MNGHIDASVDLLRFLAGVDSQGRKSFVSNRKVVLFMEFLELDHGLFLYVQHFVVNQ